jgi:hypothetical protein
MKLIRTYLIWFLAWQKICESCMSHSECGDENLFCAKSKCLNKTVVCPAICKSLTQCYCDSDSFDGVCPAQIYPTRAVRYLQGFFQNRTSIIAAPGYECIRQLTVTDKMFSLVQFPMLISHPASANTWNATIFYDCLVTAKFGVLNRVDITSESNTVDATISSEGIVKFIKDRKPHPLKTSCERFTFILNAF